MSRRISTALPSWRPIYNPPSPSTRARALLAPDNPAPGVTGILAPEGVDGSKVVRYMRDELGVTIQGGQDHMKGKLIRIGHMGYLSPFDMIVAVSAFELALRHGGYSFKLGAGVAAVEERIAQGV